jgi:hypothetical protein
MQIIKFAKGRINIKKIVLLISILFLFIYWGPKQDDVDRIMEDGVEVVINHLEPYKIKEEPTSLQLEELFTIDTEKDEIAEIGVTDVIAFDIDSEGSIYLWTQFTSKSFIYKFDKSGNFVDSFGNKGQGPDEIGYPTNLRITDSDIVMVCDARKKLLQLNSKGELYKSLKLNPQLYWATQLDNKNILAVKMNFNPETLYIHFPIVISIVESEEIKVLQQGQKMPANNTVKEINGLHLTPNFNVWSISKRQIFIGNIDNGYEFLVYDFGGKLLRKIRKEYSPVEVPQDIKDIAMKNFPENIKKKVFFPKNMPPFQYFFTDDESRLFVMTFEKGQSRNEYIYDIFNPDGSFIGRTSLGNFGTNPRTPQGSHRPTALHAVAKNKKLYHLREKESGYQELVVFKMIWE